MATLKLSTPLRSYAEGRSEVQLSGGTVGEAMQALVTEYPALKPYIFAANGGLRAYIHLFINDEDIQQLAGLDTPLKEADQMLVLPSITGGDE